MVQFSLAKSSSSLHSLKISLSVCILYRKSSQLFYLFYSLTNRNKIYPSSSDIVQIYVKTKVDIQTIKVFLS